MGVVRFVDGDGMGGCLCSDSRDGDGHTGSVGCCRDIVRHALSDGQVSSCSDADYFDVCGQRICCLRVRRRHNAG